MTERLFSTYQIAKLLSTTLGAVNRRMSEGSLKFRRMPDGTTRVPESALIDFLTKQGMDLGKVLSKAGYTEASLEKKLSRSQAEPQGEESPQAPEPEEPADTQPPRRSRPKIRTARTSVRPLIEKSRQAPEPSPRAAQICDALFSDARKQGAETIHFTPYRNGLVLQLRIGGVLRNKPNFSRGLSDSLRGEVVTHLLGLADPSIDAETLRVPIYSEFALEIDSKKLAVRLSGVPTAHGIKLVIRMPRPSVDLKTLALDSPARANLEMLLQAGGLIVVASPQKTARDEALAALLTACNTNDASVLTIGPDIETDIYAVSNLRLDPPAGLTYAAAAGAIADQDADIIVLTELRDPTTAWGAFDAAHDGALVIAGTTAASAREAISEIRAMGLESWPLSRTLKAVVERVPLPVLCEHCRVQTGESSFEAPGCEQCEQTGSSSMQVLTGIVFVDGELADLIRSDAPYEQIAETIQETCPDSLASVARQAAADGLIDEAGAAELQ